MYSLILCKCGLKQLSQLLQVCAWFQRCVRKCCECQRPIMSSTRRGAWLTTDAVAERAAIKNYTIPQASIVIFKHLHHYLFIRQLQKKQKKMLEKNLWEKSLNSQKQVRTKMNFQILPESSSTDFTFRCWFLMLKHSQNRMVNGI